MKLLYNYLWLEKHTANENNWSRMVEKQYVKIKEQYSKNHDVLTKFSKKTLFLEVLVVVIVVFMKSIQTSATIAINAAATICVLALEIVYFWIFNIYFCHTIFH